MAVTTHRQSYCLTAIALLAVLAGQTATSSIRIAVPADGATIRVPQDRPTVQAAIDAAKNGDTVLVSPGVYREAIELSGKEITLASIYLKTGNEGDITHTVLDGRLTLDGGKTKIADAVIDVAKDVGPKTRIFGFTIQGGDDGISCKARIEIAHNHFLENKDAIDYEGGGGTCRSNVFRNNKDDAVDLDGPCAALIEHNVIEHNKDDGIEIRLHKYRGATLNIVIRHNVIRGNGEDGIQIIDYPDNSDREIRIERNLIVDNAMAAIGCMSDGNTKENYEAADVPEPVFLINNTLANNQYGMTGGDSVVAVNNIFVFSAKTAMKKVDRNSRAAYNLFWKNGVDHEASNIDKSTSLFENPKFDAEYRLSSNSPCIGAGTADLIINRRVVFKAASDSYHGRTPDLGAFEYVPSP